MHIYTRSRGRKREKLRWNNNRQLLLENYRRWPVPLTIMNQPEVIDANQLEVALQEREQWQGVWPAVRVMDFHDGKISKYITLQPLGYS